MWCREWVGGVQSRHTGDLKVDSIKINHTNLQWDQGGKRQNEKTSCMHTAVQEIVNKKPKRLRKQKPASDQMPGYGGKRKKRTQADSQPKLIPYLHKCTLAQPFLPTSTSDSYQLSCIDDTKAKRSRLCIDFKQGPVIANQPAHKIQTPGQRISQKCRLAE